jgi:ABC-type antimicrobial peptide transport system permease subunit
MDSPNPYMTPGTYPSNPPPRGSDLSELGCCLVIIIGGVLGFVVGGCYGIMDLRAAVENDVQEGGPGDFLPVGIPIFAFVGAMLGTLAASFFFGAWVLWRWLRRSRDPRSQ